MLRHLIVNNKLIQRWLRVTKFHIKKSQRDSVSGWSEVWLKCTFTRTRINSLFYELRTFEPESSTITVSVMMCAAKKPQVVQTSCGIESLLQGKPMQFCYTI